MGDVVKLTPRSRLLAEFPAPCHTRLIKNGTVIALRTGDHVEYEVADPGVYRVEG